VTRVGIVDDDTVIARALGAAVSAEPDFTLVGLAESLEEGLALVAQPLDVLLVDLGLPDGDGLELLPRLRATPHGERCKVLVFSVFGDGRSVVRAIEQGADGYVPQGGRRPRGDWRHSDRAGRRGPHQPRRRRPHPVSSARRGPRPAGASPSSPAPSR
jgi:CheY-like chemotaxis protein